MQSYYNPFAEKKDELAASRDEDTRFLGKSMFWKHIEKMHPKHLYRPPTVEYRTVKMMILESMLVLMAAGLFTGHISLSFGSSIHRFASVEGVFWDQNLSQVRNLTGVWNWISADFVPKVFVQEDSYANVSSVVTPPSGWLGMSSDDSEAYIKANGIFEVSANNPGWKPHYSSGEPFEGAVLLGSARLRQISVLCSDDCEVGDICYPPLSDLNQDKEKVVLIGTPAEIVKAFTFVDSNVTQQALIKGQFATYPSSGYTFPIPLSKSDSLSRLSMLEEWSWIDPSTKAIILEFSSVNTRTKSVTSSVVLFEFSGSGGIGVKSMHVPVVIPPRTATGSFLVGIVTFAVFFAYGLFCLGLLYQTGFLDFFSYGWNYLDIVILVLFFHYLSLRHSEVGSVGSVLSPVFAALPGVFMPFSMYQARMVEIREIAAVLSILVWFRTIKCCLLISGLRTAVRVLERSVFQLATYLGIFLLGFTGLVIAWTVGFSGDSLFFQSTANSFLTLFFMAVGGADLGNFFFSNDPAVRPLVAVLLIGFVLVMLVALPALCIGIMLHEYKEYLKSEKEIAEYLEMDKAALYPPGIDRGTFWHREPVRIFIYTWYYRMLGIDLIMEKEEEVGAPEEQSIEVELLPEVLQKRWREKRAELQELAGRKSSSVSFGRRESQFGQMITRRFSALYSRAGTIFGGKGKSSTSLFSPTSPARDSSRITRIQLQRLLDSDVELVALLRKADLRETGGDLSSPKSAATAKPMKALEVIRKYGSADNVNKKLIFDNLLGDLSYSKERASARAVKRGLTHAVSELDTCWRDELNHVMEVCTEISIELVTLKSAMERLEIARKAKGRRGSLDRGDLK